MVTSVQKTSKKRNRGCNKRIGFSEELVTKDVAENLLSQSKNDIKSDAKTFRSKLENEVCVNSVEGISKKRKKNDSETPELGNDSESSKKKKKRKKHASQSGEMNSEECELGDDNFSNISESSKKEKKRKAKAALNGEKNSEECELGDNNGSNSSESSKKEKKWKAQAALNGEKQSTETEEDNSNAADSKKSDKTLSKRALKRINHQQLLDDKKKKSEIDSTNKALNYLSNWKHNRSNWKFEKLRQVWLVQHLYDSSKISDLHWNVLVEYLNSSQGKVRAKILEEAIKIIENDEIELNDHVKFNRAKEIVQSLH